MKKIKYGMIGGGFGAFIGDAHRRASRISNQFVLTGGAFDVDYEKGKEFGMAEGLEANRCYAKIEDFITGELKLPIEERIEAVAIVTPNFLHFPYAFLTPGIATMTSRKKSLVHLQLTGNFMVMPRSCLS